MIDVKKHPALHAILHRYGISPGTTLEQQAQARAELEDILGHVREARNALGELVALLEAGMDPAHSHMTTAAARHGSALARAVATLNKAEP